VQSIDFELLLFLILDFAILVLFTLLLLLLLLLLFFLFFSFCFSRSDFENFVMRPMPFSAVFPIDIPITLH